MGLDMYLTKKHYVKNWGHNPNKHKIIVKLNGEEREDINPEKISYIVEDVAYWWKFNALHTWFVDECAEGEDDCKEIYVSSDKLFELLNILKEVKKIINKAKKKKVSIKTGWNNDDNAYEEIEMYDCDDELEQIFPTRGGFFFGSTEYDEQYKQNVEKTIEMLENELIYEGSGEYYYKSSW